MTDSPYHVGTWVENQHFYGRTDLCQAIVTGNDRCIYLVGTRRVGKTSLLRRIAAQLQPSAIYIDLMRTAAGTSEQPALDELRLVRLLRQELGRLASVSEPIQAMRSLWDIEQPSICNWLDEVAWGCEDRNLHLTLLFDEAEMLRHVPTNILMQLRATFQSSRALRIILGASKGLAQLNDRWRGQDVSPFLFGFRTRYVASLTDVEANELITQRGKVRANPEIAHIIRSMTGNHPFLLQLLCDRLYRAGKLHMPQRRDISELIVDHQLGAVFQEDTAQLASIERSMLIQLANGSELDIVHLAASCNTAVTAVESFAYGLLQLGFARTSQVNTWSVGNDFLGEWLRSQPIPATTPKITDRASLEVVDEQLQQLELERSSLRLHQQELRQQSRERTVGLTVERTQPELRSVTTEIARVNMNIFERSSLVPSDENSMLRVTLRFKPTKRGAQIDWESDAFGVDHSSFTQPYTNDELVTVIKALNARQHPSYPLASPIFTELEQQILIDHQLWSDDHVSVDIHKRVGKVLYQALIKAKAGDRALHSARATARSQNMPINYLLRFPADAVALAALPWEAMHDDRQPLLLSSGGRTIDSCTRYLDLDEPISPPLPVGRKLHVLALSPDYGISPDLRDEERAARVKSWERLRVAGLLEWDELAPVTMSKLDARLRSGPRPDVIHYYGHGIYEQGQGFLFFDHPSLNGASDMVSASRLAAQLGEIRLIMIHACQSAMVLKTAGTGGILTGVAPALSAVAEAVVAMQLSVRVDAAIAFADVFYEEIARGRSLQAAVADARRALYATESDGASWYVPTLYLRTREHKPVHLIAPQ